MRKLITFFKKFRFDLIGIRIFKVITLIRFPKLWGLILNGIMPGFEHIVAIKKLKKINTLVDCGSNKGQFALILFALSRFRNYFCFDPIIEPSFCIKFLQKNGVDSIYKQKALSDSSSIGSQSFFIAHREDSSSLKKISSNSTNYFPDVRHEKNIVVDVNILDNYSIDIEKLPEPRVLKVDVQGSEIDLLCGAKKILKHFKYIFIEISFENIYEDTGKPKEVFNLLINSGFKKVISYNQLKRKGKIISRDYLFERYSN